MDTDGIPDVMYDQQIGAGTREVVMKTMRSTTVMPSIGLERTTATIPKMKAPHLCPWSTIASITKVPKITPWTRSLVIWSYADLNSIRNT